VVTAATKAVDRTSPYHTVAPPAGQIAGRESKPERLRRGVFGGRQRHLNRHNPSAVSAYICGTSRFLACFATVALDHRSPNIDRFVVISGCSGGGKSTLLTELARRGHVTVEEPGRRIVNQELLGDESALPWVNPFAFARRAVALAFADRAAHSATPGWVFFDRGLIDAAAALERLTGEPTLAALAQAHRYHNRIFLVPPWPEIYVTDTERRNDFDEAIVEYNHLLRVYPSLGYEVFVLPKAGTPERAETVLRVLRSSGT
jgi:predicted ATPase